MCILLTYANQCKPVRKNEIVDTILKLTREKPKITNNELSLTLMLHRNTISKYRKYIRKTYYKTPQEIVNKIDSRLDEELETMNHTALLSYRSQLVPKKTEVNETVNVTSKHIIVKMWQPT